jgi:hypothetical protein
VTLAPPFTHPLQIIFGVVAVAATVAESRREETLLLPHPQPLGRDAQLAYPDFPNAEQITVDDLLCAAVLPIPSTRSCGKTTRKILSPTSPPKT